MLLPHLFEAIFILIDKVLLFSLFIRLSLIWLTLPLGWCHLDTLVHLLRCQNEILVVLFLLLPGLIGLLCVCIRVTLPVPCLPAIYFLKVFLRLAIAHALVLLDRVESLWRYCGLGLDYEVFHFQVFILLDKIRLYELFAFAFSAHAVSAYFPFSSLGRGSYLLLLLH